MSGLADPRLTDWLKAHPMTHVGVLRSRERYRVELLWSPEHMHSNRFTHQLQTTGASLAEAVDALMSSPLVWSVTK